MMKTIGIQGSGQQHQQKNIKKFFLQKVDGFSPKNIISVALFLKKEMYKNVLGKVWLHICFSATLLCFS